MFRMKIVPIVRVPLHPVPNSLLSEIPMYPIDSVFILSCIYVPFLILLYVLEIWTVLKVSAFMIRNL